MPELIGLVAQRDPVVGRHHFAIRADGGEDDEMGAGARCRRRRYFQRAETARKRDLRFVGHVLIAKHQDRSFLEGRPHRLADRIVAGDI